MKQPLRLATWGLGLASATALILSHLSAPFHGPATSAARRAPTVPAQRVQLLRMPGGTTIRTETIRLPGNSRLTIVAWSGTISRGARPPLWLTQQLRAAQAQQQLLATTIQQIWQNAAPLPPLLSIRWGYTPVIRAPVTSPPVRVTHRERPPAGALRTPRRLVDL